MQTETFHQNGGQRAYYRRLMELAPVIARRAVRRENLAFHTIRALDKTERFFIDYYETPLIRFGEHLEDWWNGPRNIFWYIRLP